MYNDIVCAHII